MKVTLRQRQKGTKTSLYLEYYARGRRRYEYLNLYLYPSPDKGSLTKEQKEENRSNLKLAETIRAKRHLELQNSLHGFHDHSKLDGSFLNYFNLLCEKRKASTGNYGNWDSTKKHLLSYDPDVTFRDIDTKWIEGFKAFLKNKKKTEARNSPTLSQNSQHSYFNKLRAAIREAQKEGIIQNNPAELVEGIKAGEPQREFLSEEELHRIARTECEIPILKTAFLFSALTGLRWSDIQKLVWSEVQYSNALGHHIRFRQKKKQGTETLPVSEEAVNLLGKRGAADERVFYGLKYSAWHNLKLQQWVNRSGIYKTITFHCARHTYATLQLTMGTDIFTVSKLLGHRDLKTTQIYAKVIDEKKKAAAGKIKLGL